MPTDIIQVTVTNDGTQLFSSSKTVTDNSRTLFNPTGGVPTGTSNLLFNVAFGLDDLTAVEISTDQPVTLDTNSTTGAGGQVISLAAGDVITWVSGSALANPFTVAVTALYINNASGLPANLKMSFLINSEI
jgi:hypothetical protein